MIQISIAVYCGCVIALFLKFAVAITIQARERFRTQRFRYEEDANYFGGSVGTDSRLCCRAQALLRNDAESQPYFLVLGAAYLMLSAWPAGALLYFIGYTLSRMAHAFLLLRGRQPQRTRFFGLGLSIVLLLGVHVAVEAARRITTAI